ncbi:hypothetical protein [Lysinibacillus sp. LZ02]|uniref:hypothetical protein n=1 Tax=Lysinibacillus sp. LZ02 TaxID=3420668 RepID=UPI003D36422B
MWEYQNSVVTTVSPRSIWNLYLNVAEWTKWDKSISDAKLDGSFENGTTGYLTPIGQEPLYFSLKEVKENKYFSNVTYIKQAGIQINFYHLLETEENKTKVTHGVIISGQNAEILGKQIGPAITMGIPEAMSNLVSLAEKKSL